MPHRALFALGFFAIVFLASAARSNAMTELCPASVERVASSVVGTAALEYAYELRAGSPRTIEDATIVADTDRGWYTWSVVEVALSPALAKTTTRVGSFVVKIARSARLEVTFPQSLTVHRAWIVSAKANAVTAGWGGKGEVPCQVPAFASRDANAAELVREAAEQVEPENPATGGTAAKAVETKPIATIDCAVPFQVASVTDPATPQFPDAARELVLSQTTTEVEVSIDGTGQLLDATVYAPSANASLDQSALRAARESSYAGAISYCQSVRGQYLFSATFRP